MVNQMRIDEKILNEISRYNEINNYIVEQDVPPPPGDPGALPPPPAPEAETPQPIDVAQDPDVEEVGKDEEDKEEIAITELVNSQKNIETKQDEYFDNLFKQLENLESKLGEMDNLVQQMVQQKEVCQMIRDHSLSYHITVVRYLCGIKRVGLII